MVNHSECAVASCHPERSAAPSRDPSGWRIVAPVGVNIVAWAGYALANLNYAIEIAPAESRAHYTSVGNAAAGVGASLGPLAAAGLLTFLEPQVVQILSGAIRFTAFLSVRFARPTAHSIAPPATT